ncbi:MAG: hypothetical protein KOO61_10305 [Spirochaetales bacterium]|nr:hypothetical protein [Spirochaetales bacterium]
MDRRQKLLLRLFSSAIIIGILAGCATIRDGQASRLSDSSERVLVEGAPDSAIRDDIAETVPDSAKPEASLPSPSPATSSGDTCDPLARGAIAGEFHLSADTGWLVLPVPRISDDLALQYPPGPSDVTSGLPLILPVPPIAQAASSRPEDDVDSDAEDSGAADPDRPRAAAVVARQPVDRDVVARAPAEGAMALDASAGRSAGPDVGIADSVANPVEVERPVAPQQAARASAGTSISEPVTDAAAAILPAETEWSQRSATADPRADTVITLPGTGWLYVGREYGVGIADLIVKRSVAGDDEFVFQFSENGDYGLWFQRQDALTGRITNERLQVDASPGGSDQISVVTLTETPSAALDAGDMAEPVAAPPAAPDMVPDEPATVLTGDPGDGPAQWIETATAASQSGNLPVAVEFWQKVAAVGGADGRFARESLFELAVSGAGGASGADATVLSAAVEALRAAGELDHERLFQAAEVADAAALYGSAATYYAELTESGLGVAGLDAIYFRLGQILEMPGPARDLQRACSLYEMVIERYPLSRYWDESTAQIEYLKRHYFEIR